MPVGTDAVAAADGVADQPRAAGAGGSWMGTIARMAFMWMFMTWMKSGQKPTGGNPADPASQAHMTAPKFQKAALLDMYAFISERPYIAKYDVADLIWSETGIALAAEPETRKYSFVYEPSQASCLRASLL